MASNPAVMTAYKTAVFRIHNPSRRKRAMLGDALKRNHRAYSKLLPRLLPHIDEFKKKRRGKQREGAISKLAWPIVQRLPLSSGAKAGLCSDVAGQLSGFIEFVEGEHQENANPPTASRMNGLQTDYEAALERLTVATELAEENEARDQLLAEARAGQCRPVLFLKNRKQDGFLLLFEEGKKDYYVWLNLHSQNSRFAKPVTVKDLINARTGEVISFSSKTGALFPIEFARDFQLERFIQRAHPQSAKLLERDGQFEIHVTFEYETPKRKPKTFLGVDRGIYNLASLTAVVETGAIIERLNVDGMGLRHVQRVHERRQKDTQRRGRHYRSRTRKSMADEAVHTAANEIVRLAAKHDAQVVIENLRPITSRKGKRGRSNFNRVLNRSQYAKLQSVLEYKLAVVGLPIPKTVSAAYTSQTCPCCGHRARENRPVEAEGDGFKMDRFACVRCGYEDDADLNASRVIVLKRIWRERLPDSQRPKLMVELPHQHSFEKFLRDRAEMRGEGPCDREVGTSRGPGLSEAGPTPAACAEGNLIAVRTPRWTKKSAVKPPQLSSSSENPPLPQQGHPVNSTTKRGSG